MTPSVWPRATSGTASALRVPSWRMSSAWLSSSEPARMSSSETSGRRKGSPVRITLAAGARESAPGGYRRSSSRSTGSFSATACAPARRRISRPPSTRTSIVHQSAKDRTQNRASRASVSSGTSDSESSVPASARNAKRRFSSSAAARSARSSASRPAFSTEMAACAARSSRAMRRSGVNTPARRSFSRYRTPATSACRRMGRQRSDLGLRRATYSSKENLPAALAASRITRSLVRRTYLTMETGTRAEARFTGVDCNVARTPSSSNVASASIDRVRSDPVEGSAARTRRRQPLRAPLCSRTTWSNVHSSLSSTISPEIVCAPFATESRSTCSVLATKVAVGATGRGFKSRACCSSICFTFPAAPQYA